MNYLGIDWGTAKIGLATAFDEIKVASPFMALRYKSVFELIKELKQIIEQENIDKLIIGKPISLGGDEPITKSFNNFIEKIKELNIDYDFVDERMSTKLAQQLSKEQKKGFDDDVIAAMLILQSYLDKKKNVKNF